MRTLLFLLALSFNLFSIGQDQSFDEMVKSYYKNTVPLMYPNQLYKKMLNGEKVYILDTRESKEYQVSNVKNAIHVGYNNFSVDKVKDLNKSTTVIVYCTIGARSEQVGEKLKKAGFNEVYNLYGGMIHWKNQGYPVYNSQNKITENIHVYSKEWGIWLTKGKAVY